MNRLYATFNYPNAVENSNTFLTGIRGPDSITSNDSDHDLYISGLYQDGNNFTTFVYKGDILGNGTFYPLSYPSGPNVTVTKTSLYGPCILANGLIRVVGNYNTAEAGSKALGCLYEGPLDGSGRWITLNPQSLASDAVINTIAHSTIKDVVVGNYDTLLVQGKAFIYVISKNKYYDIKVPKSLSTTAYGVWYNGHQSYTIAGGYATLGLHAYLVDWDAKHRTFGKFVKYNYNNKPDIVTHFNGITTDGKHGYYLTGDWVDRNSLDRNYAFLAHVKRNATDACGKKVYQLSRTAKWESITFPNADVTSGNSVYKRTVIGIYQNIDDTAINGYVSFPYCG